MFKQDYIITDDKDKILASLSCCFENETHAQMLNSKKKIKPDETPKKKRR